MRLESSEVGDVGYRDAKGRLWFCGRKAHRVETENGVLFSVCCEAIFNRHPDVFRSALVGVGPRGQQQPVMIIEPKVERYPSGSRNDQFREELLREGGTSDLTSGIETVLFHRSLPVDVRHNAKINREVLALWAGEQIR